MRWPCSPTSTCAYGPRRTRRYTITTDASPLGLGGVLAFNGIVVKYFQAPVTPTVALHFGTKYGEAASQGAMEALALLVALFHWRDSLASHVTVTLQSDSVVALAMAEKLTGKSPALNRLGAELAYRLEEMGLQSLRAVHVPNPPTRSPTTSADLTNAKATSPRSSLTRRGQSSACRTFARRGSRGFRSPKWAILTCGHISLTRCEDRAAS